MRTRILSIIALAVGAVAPASGQSQSTVFFRGIPGGFGVLEQRDPGSTAAPSLPLGLTPIRLLPIEVNGRTELSRHELEQAWRFDDVPGASRIGLPAGQGSLYHHELDLGAGARVFGFFWVDAAGQVRRLVERKGTGPASDQDPFLPRVGAARDGRAVLCATTPAAGGDLLEIELASGAVIDRTQTQPPMAWHAASLFLAPQWGIAMHRSGVQSFSRQIGSSSSAVTFSAPAPVWFSGELALSPQAGFAAFVAGASPQAGDVYVLSARGSLARATALPAEISPAGYLPEHLDGPFLAVSDDGNQCAWRQEELAREAFLAEVPWQAAGSATQLTADANFTDTIDEVGQFFFRPLVGFMFTAGERALAAGGIDNIDVFSAAFAAPATAPVLQNLSQSSGILSPPFDLPGTIKPEGAVELPAAAGRLLLDRNLDRIVLLAPQGGIPATVLANVKALEGSARSGDRWILLLRRSNGSQPRQVVGWNPSTPFTTQLLYSSASADSFEHLTVRGDTCAFVERSATGDRLFGCDLATGIAHPFSAQSWNFGPGMTIAASGELSFSLNLPPTPAVVLLWRPGSVPERLGPITGPGFVIRGL